MSNQISYPLYNHLIYCGDRYC